MCETFRLVLCFAIFVLSSSLSSESYRRSTGQIGGHGSYMPHGTLPPLRFGPKVRPPYSGGGWIVPAVSEASVGYHYNGGGQLSFSSTSPRVPVWRPPYTPVSTLRPWHVAPQTDSIEWPYFDLESKRWICPDQADDSRDLSITNDSLSEDNGTSILTPEKLSSRPPSPMSVSLARSLDFNLTQNQAARDMYMKSIGINIPRTFPSTRGKVLKVPQAQPALCQPEETTVSLDLPQDPSAFFYPTCTRVRRCGGCCSHDLLSCQPTETENLRMSVLKAEYINDFTDLRYAGEVTVEVVQHKKCQCDCNTKSEDCKVGQFYVPQECRCACKNQNAERLCNLKPHIHRWDRATCACKCRKIYECSTGMIFDNNTCSCSKRDPAMPWNARDGMNNDLGN